MGHDQHVCLSKLRTWWSWSWSSGHGPWGENVWPTKVFMYQELVQETSATLQIH